MALNQPPVNAGSLWVYNGKALSGQGRVHRVIFAEPHEIVTISDTHSWLGDKYKFAEEFTPLK
jgi:hypothetical protein